MQRLFTVAILLIIAAGPTGAQQISDAQRQACMGDYHKFCSSIIPGGGRIAACLRKNQDQLSAECRAALPQSAPAR